MTEQSIRAAMEAGNAAVTVLAVLWVGDRYPRGAAHQRILVLRRLMVRQAVLVLPEAAEDGSLEIMACAGNPVQVVPAMWRVLQRSPIMGNITLRKQKQE